MNLMAYLFANFMSAEICQKKKKKGNESRQITFH